MIKVITYGTFDLLHHGHIRLLQRAKALGDYMIVGVTTDDFDKSRGKINVQQSFMERIEALKALGIADEVIAEEYEGQKIDDIKRYGIDVFTVGSDWEGQFDYLKGYCDVIYLKRTEGISSSEIRGKREIRLGLAGDLSLLCKYKKEAEVVNGIRVTGVFTNNEKIVRDAQDEGISVCTSYDELLGMCDAVYIATHPSLHYEYIKRALLCGKHVLCESPIAIKYAECRELFQLSQGKCLVLMDAIKTAYSTAYNRLLLLVKSGRIGKVLSIDFTCTSLGNIYEWDREMIRKSWKSTCAWGPAALLPIFQIAGTEYKKKIITSYMLSEEEKFDAYTRVDFIFPNLTASARVGKGVKSEGELVISGTKGYIYVPAPWWKTDYFEVRYEELENNKRYFYQLDGEGIRYEILAFVRAIESGKSMNYLNEDVSGAIVRIMEDFETGVDVQRIR